MTAAATFANPRLERGPAPSPWGEGGGEGEDSRATPKVARAQRKPGDGALSRC